MTMCVAFSTAKHNRFATSAAEAGASELTIMATTGHKSSQMVKRYVRRANLLRSTAASVAGL